MLMSLSMLATAPASVPTTIVIPAAPVNFNILSNNLLLSSGSILSSHSPALSTHVPTLSIKGNKCGIKFSPIFDFNTSTFSFSILN